MSDNELNYSTEQAAADIRSLLGLTLDPQFLKVGASSQCGDSTLVIAEYHQEGTMDDVRAFDAAHAGVDKDPVGRNQFVLLEFGAYQHKTDADRGLIRGKFGYIIGEDAVALTEAMSNPSPAMEAIAELMTIAAELGLDIGSL